MIQLARLLALALLLTTGCIGDDERCDDDQRYVNGGCLPLMADAATDTLNGKTDNGKTDDQSTTMPGGMGDVCSKPEDCAGKEADYCLVQPPSTTGSCTVKDCNATVNDCPTGFTCCDFAIPNIPNFCAKNADYTTLKGMAMCVGG